MLKQRIENLDILRCVSMLMVVVLHVVGQGGVTTNIEQHFYCRIPVFMLKYAFICSVNVFMLISGFIGVQIKFRYSRIVILYIQTFFWSFVLKIFIYHFFSHSITYKLPIIRYVPLFTIYYWFFTSYFIVFFAMPLMNFVIKTWTKNQLRTTILTFFFLFCVITGTKVGFHGLWNHKAFLLNNGFSPLWLAYVYFIGGFMAQHGISSLLPNGLFQLPIMAYFRRHPCISTWGGYFTILFLGYSHLKINSHLGAISKFYTPDRAYNDLYIFLMALFLFEAFRRTHFPLWIKLFGKSCAPYAFGVFLIHTQYDFYSLLENRFAFITNFNAFFYVPLILSCSFGIFILCCILDWLRSLIFSLLHIKPIVQKILKEI